jgi:hypothetical protein
MEDPAGDLDTFKEYLQEVISINPKAIYIDEHNRIIGKLNGPMCRRLRKNLHRIIARTGLSEVQEACLQTAWDAYETLFVDNDNLDLSTSLLHYEYAHMAHRANLIGVEVFGSSWMTPTLVNFVPVPKCSRIP